MQRRVASRVNAIRACLNAEAFATGPRSATPPVDGPMRERLERCLARLQLVWRRLGAVRIGDGRQRLVAEFEMVERTCEAADALLEATVGPSSCGGALSGRCGALGSPSSPNHPPLLRQILRWHITVVRDPAGNLHSVALV